MQSKPDFHHSLFSEIPENVGPRLATLRGGVAHVVRPPGSQSIAEAEHNFISIMLAPTQGLRSAIGGDRLHEYDAEVGTIVITPAGMDAHAVWQHTRENATIVLPASVLQELAEQERNGGRSELQLVPFGTVDPWALHIAELMKAELSRKEGANELFVESLVTILGVHLLRRYGGIGASLTRTSGGLSSRQAQRVRQYMETHVSRKISIADLASVAGLSRHYFIQSFAKTFGKSPHQYLIDLRLDFAEKLLVRGDLAIANVAHLCGFSSQSHLTTTMRMHRNITPMQVRLRG